MFSAPLSTATFWTFGVEFPSLNNSSIYRGPRRSLETSSLPTNAAGLVRIG